MSLLLQNKHTLGYVQATGGWTMQHDEARRFRSWLEALLFCFNQRLGNMQILGESADSRMNFSVPVTGLQQDQ